MKIQSYQKKPVELLQVGDGHGSHMTISPDYGFVLTDLCFLGTPVLKGNQTLPTLEIADMRRSSWLLPFANRLENGTYRWGAESHQFPVNEEKFHNNLHGFPETLPFQMTALTFQDKAVSVGGQYIETGRAYFPFPFVLKITYTLKPTQCIVQMEIQNVGNSPMPIALGWHPYFSLGPLSSTELKISGGCQVEVNERMIPTGKINPLTRFKEYEAIGLTQLDTCFRAEDQFTTVKMRHQEHILVYLQNNHSFPYFQLFTPGDDTLAIEPMMGNINCFNNGGGLKVLQPKEHFEDKVYINYYRA